MPNEPEMLAPNGPTCDKDGQTLIQFVELPFVGVCPECQSTSLVIFHQERKEVLMCEVPPAIAKKLAMAEAVYGLDNARLVLEMLATAVLFEARTEPEKPNPTSPTPNAFPRELSNYQRKPKK